MKNKYVVGALLLVLGLLIAFELLQESGIHLPQAIGQSVSVIGGIVVGTGDLSELALGWCTYNGDHMSMYGVNGAIPKTLVRHLVRHEANRADAALRAVLLDVLDETTLQLSDVLRLQVNDIIPLGKSIDGNVVLKIGDRQWFDGKMGTFNNKKAVKIENVYRIEV